MKILLVHNFYGGGMPSGENQVFERERKLLESKGHEVRVFARHNEDYLSQGVLGFVRGGLSVVWNPVSAREMRAQVEEFQPKIVHVHNSFPILSSSIFSAAVEATRVFTLHNYRLFCASGVVYRDGNVCTECMDRRSSLPALVHGCYRNSRVATLPVAVQGTVHRRRGTWTRDVDAYIALTEFQKQRVVAAGLPEHKVFVKPNFCPEPKRIIPWGDRLERVVYVGRLSAEKGVEDLVTAWLEWGAEAPQLVMLGDGPLRSTLQSRIDRAESRNVQIAGQVTSRELEDWVGRSKLAIVPSNCLEAFGLAVIEAMAVGTPVLVSNAGSLPDLVGSGGGSAFRAGDANDLLSKTRGLWRNDGALQRMSVEGRRSYESRYASENNYQQLLAIYESAMRLKLQGS